MARPNQDRVRVGIWLARAGVAAVKAEAQRQGVPANAVYREVFRLGWQQYRQRAEQR